MTINVQPATRSASTGGGWGGFFESIIDSGKGAAHEWWEGRLDTELSLSSGKDSQRLAAAGVAGQGAGVDEIDNASAYQGQQNAQQDNTLLYVGLGVLALVGVMVAVKS